MFFFSSKNVERVESGKHDTDKNEAESTRQEPLVTSDEVATKEDEMHPLDVIKWNSEFFCVPEPKTSYTSKQNRYFESGEVLKENLIYNLTDHSKCMIYKNYFV